MSLQQSTHGVCVFQAATLAAACVYIQNSHLLVNQCKLLLFDIFQLFHSFNLPSESPDLYRSEVLLLHTPCMG